MKILQTNEKTVVCGSSKKKKMSRDKDETDRELEVVQALRREMHMFAKRGTVRSDERLLPLRARQRKNERTLVQKNGIVKRKN